MKAKYYLILILILAIIITYYWAMENACVYCFQHELAKDYKENFTSSYTSNIKDSARHFSTNTIGDFVRNILKNDHLNLLFWLVISSIVILIFFKILFNLKIAIFSLFIYITNTTLNVTVHTIIFYFLSLFCLYKLIKDKMAIYLFFIPLLMILSLTFDISSSFVIFVTIISVSVIYLILDLIENKHKINLIYIIALIIFSILIALIFERNYFIYLLDKIPYLFNKGIFYITSYPKGTYFYIYVLEKIILLIIPIIYFINCIKNFKREKGGVKSNFIFSYLLSILPLTIFFIVFGVFARIFDYYNALLAAISLGNLNFVIKNKNLRKLIIILVILFFTFVSIFVHYIPPRSLERYDENFINSLDNIPKGENVYTDVFVANALMVNKGYINVNGADFNIDKDEYLNVYYNKNANYMKDLFKRKNIDYFVISKHSLSRGLDILNAPHFLKPITNIDEYDKMPFLKVYYKDNEIMVWEFLNENSNIS